MTVKEALKIGKLQEGQVVAGQNGLERIIRFVDILEVPDIINWLQGGQLLLTTGYAIKDQPEIQEKLIEELARVNAAGIVIKLKRFLDIVPEKMIQKADELNLPIIQLPAEIPYIEIIHPLYKEILLRQNEKKLAGEMFKEIVYGEFNEAAELKKRLSMINSSFNVESPFIIIMIRANHLRNLRSLLKVEEIKENSGFITVEIEDNFVILYPVDIKGDWEKSLEKSLFHDFAAVNETIHNGVSCIVSRVLFNTLELPEEYRRVYSALRVLHQLPVKKAVNYYREIIHYIFLNEISKLEITHEFVKYVLQPLLDGNKKEREDLVNTLYELVKNDGNLTQTARRAFIHRNTLRYRIGKLVKILHTPLNSPEEFFKYNLALTLYKLMRRSF